MPYLTVYTNVEFKNGAALAEEASELTARVLGKPVGYVVANFIYNPNMAFGGSAAAKGGFGGIEVHRAGRQGCLYWRTDSISCCAFGNCRRTEY